MSRLVISEEARSEDLADLALALNEIIQLPVTMRGSKYPGVRVEKAGFWIRATQARSWKRSSGPARLSEPFRRVEPMRECRYLSHP